MDEKRLRDELEWVLANCDSGAVSEAVFAVVKKLETDLSWLKHQSGESQYMAKRNLIGLEVGDLKVVGHWFAETWACRCSCGREALVHADDLVSAQMRSCGCKPGTRRPQRRPGFPNAPRAKRL